MKNTLLNISKIAGTLVLSLFSVVTLISAENIGAITGIVIDSETKKPLQSVNVILEVLVHESVHLTPALGLIHDREGRVAGEVHARIIVGPDIDTAAAGHEGHRDHSRKRGLG